MTDRIVEDFDANTWRDLFISIIEDAEGNVLLLNERLEVVSINQGFYWIFLKNYGIDLHKGVSIIEKMKEVKADLVAQTWRERCLIVALGKSIRAEETFELDGRTYFWEVYFKSVFFKGKRFISVFSRDITIRKSYQRRIHETKSHLRTMIQELNSTQDQLRQQNEELIKINTELDRFVYSASHDLRAPLMSIKGLINMIKIDPEKENREACLNMMEMSVNKLDGFISDIIDYSRNARSDLAIEEIDFNRLIDDSINSLKFMDGAEYVRSEKKVEVRAAFYSDYGRLLIIFNNIISNAVQYRNFNEPDSFISIAVAVDDDAAIINFNDNGIGIPEKHLNKIFNMFFRASTESKGSGLGLYIVKGAVDKLKGSISVESEYGVGTRFSIRIPNEKTGMEK